MREVTARTGPRGYVGPLCTFGAAPKMWVIERVLHLYTGRFFETMLANVAARL
jgi:hypothetical protein